MTAPTSRARWRQRIDHELLKEGYTMALYCCVVLLAAFEATHEAGSTWASIELVWGTSVGLALAHWFAFSWAGRLVDRNNAAALVKNRQIAAAQIAGALVVAAAISILVAVTPHSSERAGARIGAACLIGGLVYLEEHWSGAKRQHSALIAVTSLLVALVIALIKNRLVH